MRQRGQALSVRGNVMALLVLYLAAFIASPAAVPHVHDDARALHNDSCRIDPCHNTVYHPGDKIKCHHKYHLTPADSECPYCKNVVLPQEVPYGLSLESWHTKRDSPDVSLWTSIHLPEIRYSASRGPPSIA